MIRRKGNGRPAWGIDLKGRVGIMEMGDVHNYQMTANERA